MQKSSNKNAGQPKNHSRNTFTVMAAGLLVVALVASGSLAGIGPWERSLGTLGGDEDTNDPLMVDDGKEPEPWWVDWLAHFDETGTGVDDRAEQEAQELIRQGRSGEPVRVLITYDGTPEASDADLLEQEYGVEVLFVFEAIPTIAAAVPADKVSALGGVPGVVAVEHDQLMEVELAVSVPATQAREYIGGGSNTVYNGQTAQSLGYTGQDRVIAVLDTGVQKLHTDLLNKLVTGVDTSAMVAVPCVAPVDDHGHGTHVASTALGDPPNNRKGAAADARLVDIDISIPGGSAFQGAMNAAFQWVLNHNAAIDSGQLTCPTVGPDDRVDVVTMSFGSAGPGGPNAGTTGALIDQLTQNGVVVTISAGNCGPSGSSSCTVRSNQHTVTFPANAAGAIAVAASNDRRTVDRSDDLIAGFSSRGPNSGTGATDASNLLDRHRKPDITAPGTSIVAHGPAPFTISTASGTSMAAPHVAGIAALLIQAGDEASSQTGGVNLMRPVGTGFDANGDYVLGDHPVRDAMIHSSDYTTQGALATWTGPNAIGLPWNNAWGYGAINAFAALCWAWQNVLVPGGATAPAAITNDCPTNTLSVNAGGPYEAELGEPVTFSATAQGGTPPYSFEWDFGDGNTGTGSSPTHTYQEAGTYTVQLTVTDTDTDTLTGFTTAAITEEEDEEPPEEPGPFVEITNPQDGDTVEGITLIEGVAGHMGDDPEASAQTPSHGSLADAQSIAHGNTPQAFGFNPGEDATLWFRGETAATGIGSPNLDGSTEARLSTEPPTGVVPVVHTGTGFGPTQGPPIVLTSDPLDGELRIGSGDGSSPEVEATFQLAPYVPSTTNTFLNVELVASDGTETRVLAQGSTPRLDQAFLTATEGLVELTLEPNPDQMNTNGDLVITTGETLQIQMNVDTPPFSNTRYAILYDAVDFDGRIEFPVSPFSGSPAIVDFQGTPDLGVAPLEVTFNGTVEEGLAGIDRVEIDPGDGSALFEADLDGDFFQAVHTYMEVGDWIATATVFDVEGRSGSAVIPVTVLGEEPEEAVFVQINDGERMMANDTSTGGDWSSWSLEYDFSAHGDGTQVSITAVYFDGEVESDPDTIIVNVVSDEEPKEPEGTGNVTIESPAEGSALEFPVTFEGSYEVFDGTDAGATQEQEQEGQASGQVSENKITLAAGQGAAPRAPLTGGAGKSKGIDLADILPSGGDQVLLQKWLSDPFVRFVFESDEVHSFQQEASGWDGYFTLFPDPDEGRLVVAMKGPVPDDAPAFVGGIPVHYEEFVQPEPLGGAPVEEFQGHDDGPNIPGIQGGGAGPGAPIRMGNFICSASYLVQDEITGRYFISTAGHCIATATGEYFGGQPGASVFGSVSVCVENCIMNIPQFGDWITFSVSGDYHPVFYARHQGVGADFGLIEVPDEHVDALRPVLTQWGGPDAMQNPSLGQLLAHYGHGSYCCPLIGALATRSPVDQGRVAVGLGSGFNDFSGLGWPTGGDSGSAVSTAGIQAPGIIQGQNAAGVLTHGIVVAGAPILSGTTMTSGLQRVDNLAGTSLRLVTQHEDPQPQCPASSPCPPMARFTHDTDGIHASFDASGSFHPRYTAIDSYQWDLGDGNTREGEFVEHTYQEAGTYRVKLTVTDANGEWNTTAQDVVIEETDSPWRLEVRVVDDGGDEVVAWHLLERPEPGESGGWSFTWDGPAEPGGYFLQARLTERNETRDMDERRYEVLAEALTVDAGGPYQGSVDEPVVFSGSVEGGVGPYTFSWDFGDGNTGTGESPEHTYKEAGEYVVVLNVTDAEDRTAEDVTLANITKDPVPFVRITTPEDQDRVEGLTMIEGIAGHNGDGDANGGEVTMAGEWDPLVAGASASGVGASGDGVSFEPGTDVVLWFRGETAATGIGMPNLDGSADARLSTEPPTGVAPVVHTGTGFGPTQGPPIILVSEPMDGELRIGSGDGPTDGIKTTFQLAPFVPSTTNTFLNVELVASSGTETRVLAQGSTPRLDQAFLTATEGHVELTLEPNPDQMNTNGDLVITTGENLQIQMNVDTPPFSNTRYAILYDAVDFEGRIEFPVSPLTGSPVVSDFQALPGQGGLPLEVTFNGSVQVGLEEIDRVEIDPGDGTGVFQATLDGQGFTGNHVYREEGVWEATATVFDVVGKNGTASVLVTVTFDEGVYLSIDGGPIERATDTSDAGDWSTWAFEHNFSVYANGTEVQIEAVYFDGQEMSVPHVITVVVGEDPGDPEDPVAVIHGPSQVRRGENVSFDGSDSQGNIVEWSWDFGDGNTATGPVVDHAWDNNGPHNVTLTVRDPQGVEDTATHRVVVTGGPQP